MEGYYFPLVSPKQVRLPNTLSVINRNQQDGSDDESLSSRIKTFMQYSQGQDVSPRGGRSIGRTVSSIFYVKNRNSIPSQTTSFANRQPDPVFQVSETPNFTPDLCKASLTPRPLQHIFASFPYAWNSLAIILSGSNGSL